MSLKYSRTFRSTSVLPTSIVATDFEVSALVAICPYEVSVVPTEPVPETAIIAEITVDKISHVSYLTKSGRSPLPIDYSTSIGKVNLYNQI